ncbi:GntR family transcriptional regulator [Alkalihalobacillus oceani]|uniref:GntR family transcriptional regulator n=1 Tax=Halalkalibacter oceani TaxID=1653776 RepID=UPI00203FD9DB|nr:GntR family transcriptional regulator [Halalkalibacter oceani]MCM3762982.1 GntR family transcriptional regulator [Halalkalibacter oceani]
MNHADVIAKELMWEKVLESLRRQIILGQLKKGEHLKEIQLSKKFGVSRGPIRESIKQLEKEGLVYTSRNGRTCVLGLSKKDIENIYYARILLEVAAVEQIAFPLQQSYIHKMRKLIEEVDDNKQLTREEVDHYDLLFHYHLVGLSENRMLVQMWLSMKGTIKTIMEITNKYNAEKNIKVINQHKDIVESLVSHDKPKVKRLIKSHLTDAKNAIIKGYKEV